MSVKRTVIRGSMAPRKRWSKVEKEKAKREASLAQPRLKQPPPPVLAWKPAATTERQLFDLEKRGLIPEKVLSNWRVPGDQEYPEHGGEARRCTSCISIRSRAIQKTST